MKLRLSILLVTTVLLIAPTVSAQNFNLSSFPDFSEYTQGKSDPTKWYYVGGSSYISHLLQPSSVKVNGAAREFWIRVIDDSDGAVLKLNKWNVDCKTFSRMLLYTISYYEHGEDDEGRIINRRKKQDSFDYAEIAKWIPIAPGTVAEAFGKAVCSIK